MLYIIGMTQVSQHYKVSPSVSSELNFAQSMMQCAVRIMVLFVKPIHYKWKNRFCEMKGDVGMSLPKETIIYECIRQWKNIFTSNFLPEIRCGLERNKDVGMGL